MTRLFTEDIKFKALFDHATEGILVSDAGGVIQVANRSAERLFQYDSGELAGKKVEVLIPPRVAKVHSSLRAEFNLRPGARNMGHGRDLFAITKGGQEFPVEISLSPYGTEAGNFTIAFIIDITVRKNNEKAIEIQKAQLEALTGDLENRVRDRTLILEEALQQLELSRAELHAALEKERVLGDMKSRFVTMASHEIRTPLATILSSLTLVDKYIQANNKEKTDQHIRRIKSTIHELTTLLDDVLLVSHLEEGAVAVDEEQVSIDQVVENAIADVSGDSAAHRILYDHTGRVRIPVDRKILRSILVNIISNAVKFSPGGTEVFVNTYVDRRQLRIQVRDQGIGIPAGDRQHVFERFFRGGNVGAIPGTGLGLNIVARYIELLKGSIAAEPAQPNGTLIIINIPLDHAYKNPVD